MLHFEHLEGGHSRSFKTNSMSDPCTFGREVGSRRCICKDHRVMP